MPQRPVFRVSAVIVSAIATATMLFAPLAPAFATSEGSGTPSHNPAAGVGGGVPVAVLADTGRVAEQAYDTIWTQITRAVMVAFFNALQIFFSQLAYDAANYIASGGQGQETVFYRKGFDAYISDVAGDAAGEFIGSISNSNFFQNIGFDLCRPSDPHYLLRLQLSLGNFFPGLQSRFQRQRPRCNWQDIKNNWQTFASSVTPQDLYKSIDLGLQTNQNDFGISASILGRFQLDVGRKLSASVLDRQEGAGFKATKNILTGDVKTPSAVILEKTKSTTVTDPANHQTAVVGAMLSTGFQQGALQLLQYTASVFLNTLVSKSMQRLFGQGIASSIDLPRQQVTRPDEITTAGKTDARNANIDLRTPNLFKVSTFEVMAEFVACPESNRGAWNCVMDQSLAQALQSQSEQGGYTIQEALNRGYLHSDWRLIPNTPEHARENTDPQCFTYAYCAGNLAKLRLLRVLPVGVEFAANSQFNIARCSSSQGCITLGEVVSKFNDCGPDAPWCKLVDPNWVLALPPQQCALKGYGDSLLSPQIGQRKEECQDVQTCLQRDDKGQCVGGYGYCLAEKTVYRFGADECPANFSSCRQYTDRTGNQVGYLRNTLDRAQCDASNVGCLWYATARDPLFGTAGWIGTTSTGPRVYFDKTLQSCPPDQEGCTSVYVGEFGKSSLNLVLNPSFERKNSADSARLDAWSYSDNRTYAAPEVTAGEKSLDGLGATLLDARATGLLTQRVRMEPGRVYTLSFYTRSRYDQPSTTLKAAVVEYADEGFAAPVPSGAGSVMARLYRSSTCAPGGPIAGQATPGIDYNAGSSDWQRVSCSFLTTSSTKAGEVQLWGVTNPTDVMVDAVQLEEGEYATDFVDGINRDLAQTNIKVPPDDFQCKGTDADATACSKFARVCQQADAGCDSYTDTRLADSSVPAIVSPNDLCPASCVGYAEFRKQPTSFDLVQDIDTRFDDPQEPTSTYFIPTTAQQCSAENVGCEEFTNVETGAAGGETKAYFTYLRSCRKPGNDAKTYFTWEGSDVSGYQLRTWSLVKDDAATPGPKVVLKRQPGDLYFKEPGACNRDTYTNAADPDCRQFYDESGNAFYRYYSQTVLSTNNCTSFRLNVTDRSDCEKTDGAFNAATNECIYQAYVPESNTCSQQFVGCRAYAGSTAGGLNQVYSEDFRGDTGTFSTGSISEEALLVGDKSLRVVVPAGASAGTASFDVPNTDGDALYRLTFWLKSTQTGQVSLTQFAPENPSTTLHPIGTVAATTDWQRFTVGPFHGGTDSSTTTISFALPAGSSARSYFIDEVAVTELGQVEYAKEESWNTPAECDRTPGGNQLPLAMLGCREYKNRANQTLNVKSFSRLCREQAVGCRAFVDTRNSSQIESQTFVRGDSPAGSFGFPNATTTRAADRMLYLVDDKDKHCKPENASCRAFGKPVFAPDRQTVAGYETVFYKDDITLYSEALCKPSELFCDEFKTPAGSEYFRNPGTHACEYRTDVSGVTGVVGLPDGQYEGWFVKGSNTPCYSQLLSGGKSFSIAKIGDQPYAGWGGLCGQENAECTEFRDANDTADPRYPTGKPYYFLKNDKIDTTACAGQIDPAKGCVLLNDMTDGYKKYRTDASYAKYQAGGYVPMTAVDCTTDPRDPSCAKSKGTCGGTIRYCTTSNCAPGSVGPDIQMETAIGIWSRLGPGATFPGSTVKWESLASCTADAQCTDATPVRSPDGGSWYQRRGTCQVANDANIVVRAKLDRDCAQWLGCSSAETVLEPGTNKYKDLCTAVSMCNQASQTPGDVFCGAYVNRATTATEPILTKGAFFDQRQYVSREVGLGKLDYTGYAVPNAFQAVDLVTRNVAVEGLQKQDKSVKYRYALDYRLAASVPMPPIRQKSVGSVVSYFPLIAPKPNEAAPIAKDSVLGARYPSLNLCQHVASGRIGYFVPPAGSESTSGLFCILPVESTGDAYDFQNISQKFALANPKDDQQLLKAFPNPECRAQPEADAPFPASFTTEWDTTVNPPKAKSRVAGFQNANTCEQGEDCECSYKRAEFSGAAISKFYDTESQNIPPGICQGGPRDGQSCLPNTVFQAPDPNSYNTPEGKARADAINKANAAQTCGPLEGGGRCVPFSRVSIIRGVFGQCLERDATRTVGNSLDKTPCLTWNPTPILFGDKDAFHYYQPAGYSPPENSGQYYCLSENRPPNVLHMSEANFVGPRFAGNQTKLSYDIRYYRANDYCDNIGIPCNQDKAGGAVDGGKPSDSPAFDNCKRAAGQESYQSTENDGLALRLVGSGRYKSTSYSETFYQINPDSMSSLVTPGEATGLEQGDIATRDTTISYFTMNPIDNVNGTGRLACGYQAEWVDGLGTVTYGDPESLRSNERDWRDKFNQNWVPVMARGSEQYLADPGGHPIAATCVQNNLPVLPGQDPNLCYFKTWETGYRANNQKQKFTGIYYPDSNGDPVLSPNSNGSTGAGGATGEPNRLPDENSFSNLSSSPFYRECTSDKPYFAVRAVFQQRAPGDQAGQTGQARRALVVNGDSLPGSWNFVGFWVATCAGGANDYRYMYLNVDVNASKICRDLAEVRSVNSRQDAAYTDRLWKNSQYVVPQLGIQYGARYSPFSSALNVKPAGLDPLFLSGSEASGFSRSNPPSFLGAPAQSFFSSTPNAPKDKWAYLTNLFARIYRVYKYEDRAVTLSDKICVNSGRMAGNACSVDGQCSVNGTCDTGLVTQAEKANLKFCNSLSGINAGVMCSANTATQDLCHQAPLARDPDTAGGYIPLRESCKVNASAGWRTDGEGDALRYVASTTALGASPGEQAGHFTREDAASRGAFVCDTGSVRAGQPCDGRNQSDGTSVQCPTRVVGKCVKPVAVCLNDLRGGYVLSSVRPAMGRCALVGGPNGTPPRAVAALWDQSFQPLIPATGPTPSGFTCGNAQFPDATNKFYSYDDPTLSTWQNGQPVPYRNQNKMVGDEYAPCFQDTDCNFDEWNYWSETQVPYVQQAAGGTPWYTENKNGYLWGPIYSIRSSINREWGEQLGASDPTTMCRNAHNDTDQGGRWLNKPDGTDKTGLCLGSVVMTAHTITSGYSGYNPGNDCGGDGITNTGCTNPNLFGTRLSDGTTVQWGSDTSRPGLWPRNTATGGGVARNRVPFLRHQDELRRPPGVAETVVGKGELSIAGELNTGETGGVRRLSANSNTYNGGPPYDYNRGAWFLDLAKCDSLEKMDNAFTQPRVLNDNGCYGPLQCTNPPTLTRGATISNSAASSGAQFGRCAGGFRNGGLCRVSDNPSFANAGSGGGYNAYVLGAVSPHSPYSCELSDAQPAEKNGICSLTTPDNCTNSSGAGSDPRQVAVKKLCYPNTSCPTVAAVTADPTLDKCVHDKGYIPRPDLCPDPKDEFCGLVTYDRSVPAGLSVNSASLNPDAQNFLPTDVTLGNYTPYFLGFTTKPPGTYTYVGYYTPRPPQIAAPDLRSCNSPGECRVESLGRFSFAGQSEGQVSVSGGQYKASLRFYGWASHEQMPLRRLVVDWGDNQRQELPDAKMKNHKPFCGVAKECWSDPINGFTGLTCNTDTDCPAGAGVCKPLGNCSRRPNVACSSNDDCTEGSGPNAVPDTCTPREFFGNSPEACESNFFEFEHAYACTQDLKKTLPSCRRDPGVQQVPQDVVPGACYFGTADRDTMNVYTSQSGSTARPSCSGSDTATCAAIVRDQWRQVGEDISDASLAALGLSCGPPSAGGAGATGFTTGARCSRDPSRLCCLPGQSCPAGVADFGCATNDVCVPDSLAPVGGCWDDTVQSCRFTPRLLMEDNWGWCTGECRAAQLGGQPADTADSKVIHKYGGCWSGSTLGNNESTVTRNNLAGTTRLITDNQCNASFPSVSRPSIRPWVVYQGSLQLRVQ